MASPADFINSNLTLFGYQSKQELIEKLYLRSLIESYHRIAHTVSTENDIRDRFMKDLHQTPSKLKIWLDLKLMYLDWENWKFTPGFKLSRADISFKITGCEFIIEYKRLRYADNQYIDEGLSRFITHHYAKGDEYAGMIGFVVTDKGNHIHDGLKAKVSEYNFVVTPFSKSTYSDHSSSFLSSHQRTDGTIIHAYHLLFSFTGMTESIGT